jgi:glycosyltransferase involved in cell wall biosynthesis
MEAIVATVERAKAASSSVSRNGPHRQVNGSALSATRAVRQQPLAFFSPLLPLRSGIADYSQRLLAVLKRHFWIDLYHDHDYLPELSVSSADFACRDHRLFDRFQRATDYAGIVYQMANTHMCAYLYDMLLRHPGVVVLHDYALPEFHFGYALRPGAPADFIATEIALESPELAEEYRTSVDAWRAEPGGIAQACLRRGLAFNRRVLDAAAVIVVHDRSGAEQIARSYPHLVSRVRVIPHGANVYSVPASQKLALRERYGFKADELILSCFGFLNGAKYHTEVIEAVASLTRDFPSVRLIFVGSDLNEGREQARAAELGLGDRVRFFGHAPMETFLDLMSVTDLAMNLRRPPTRGETSGALLTLLSAGVPTIVTNVDTFASYADAVVQKIGPLFAGDRSLEEAIRRLLSQPGRRTELGLAAVRYVAEIHDWQRVASLYADAVDQARAETVGRAA